MKIKVNIDIKVGRVVKYLILADFFLLAGWGFISPLLSVFIVQKIAGATLTTVGIAVAIYWILKSILQIPIANYLDRTPGEKDDFVALIGGLLLVAFSSFAFTWVTHTWELYLVQAVQAIAFALYIPSWSAIFSRHLDRERVSFDWSLDSTVAGVASGASGFLAGIIATLWGFNVVFIIAGLISMIAAVLLIMVPDLVLPKTTGSNVVINDKSPASVGH